MDHISKIARLITEDPDVINELCLVESRAENKIRRMLALPHDQPSTLKTSKPTQPRTARTKKQQLDDEIKRQILEYSLQDQFQQLNMSVWVAAQLITDQKLFKTEWAPIIDYIHHLKQRGKNIGEYLRGKTFKQIDEEQQKWHESLQVDDTEQQEYQLGKEKLIHDFKDGYKIVQLMTKQCYTDEGERMGHCVGSYDENQVIVYSLRDSKNNPHATIGVSNDGIVEQAKGKNNEPVVKKYSKYVIGFLDSKFEFPKDYNSSGTLDYINSSHDANKLLQLSKNKDSVVRIAATMNPSMPPEGLMIAIKDENTDMKLAAVKNPSMPSEGLMIAVKDEDYYVREAAANNPSMPPEGLMIAIKDKHPGVRWATVKNPSMPPEGLMIAIKDENTDMRWAAARNPSMPPEGLMIAIKDACPDVRVEAAGNPSMPPEGLMIAVKDEDFDVRNGTAGNFFISPEELMIAIKDVHSGVRWAAARDPSMPPEGLMIAVKDKHPGVRWTVAKNPSMPPEGLMIAVKDKHPGVRWLAVKNAKERGIKLESFLDQIANLITEDPDVINEFALDPEVRGLQSWGRTASNLNIEKGKVGKKEFKGKKDSVEVELDPADYEHFVVHTHPKGSSPFPSETDLRSLTQSIGMGYKGMAIFCGRSVVQLMPKPTFKGVNDGLIRRYLQAISTDEDLAVKVLEQMGLKVERKIEDVI